MVVIRDFRQIYFSESLLGMLIKRNQRPLLLHTAGFWRQTCARNSFRIKTTLVPDRVIEERRFDTHCKTLFYRLKSEVQKCDEECGESGPDKDFDFNDIDIDIVKIWLTGQLLNSR